MIIFYIFYVTLMLVIIFLVHKITSRNLVNICSFWYLDKKKNKIVQYFNLGESYRLLKLRKSGRRNVILYVRDTMIMVANSNILKVGTVYYIEYHLIKHMKKVSGIEIISHEFKSERFLWEIIFFIGIKRFMGMLLSEKRSQLKVKYYAIAFTKTEGVEICTIE